MTYALEIKNLKKSFGNLEVIRGLSLTAKKGDVICIIGTSGSGKSTLLRCVNLLETPDSGVQAGDPLIVIDVSVA